MGICTFVSALAQPLLKVKTLLLCSWTGLSRCRHGRTSIPMTPIARSLSAMSMTRSVATTPVSRPTSRISSPGAVSPTRGVPSPAGSIATAWTPRESFLSSPLAIARSRPRTRVFAILGRCSRHAGLFSPCSVHLGLNICLLFSVNYSLGGV